MLILTPNVQWTTNTNNSQALSGATFVMIVALGTSSTVNAPAIFRLPLNFARGREFCRTTILNCFG